MNGKTPRHGHGAFFNPGPLASKTEIENSPSTREIQAHRLCQRLRFSPSLAATVAALAYPEVHQ